MGAWPTGEPFAAPRFFFMTGADTRLVSPSCSGATDETSQIVARVIGALDLSAPAAYPSRTTCQWTVPVDPASQTPPGPEADAQPLTAAQAAARLAELAQLLAEANTAYHQADAPRISDADYDALKRENAALEARFPTLKRPDSPSAQVGAAPADGFQKVTHARADVVACQCVRR